MKLTGNTSARIQLFLFALALLYLVSANLRFAVEKSDGRLYHATAVTHQNTAGKLNLYFTEAQTIHASDCGILFEKEVFVLPLLLLFSFILLPIKTRVRFPLTAFRCHGIYFFRILPNGP